mmetsp:Transcript_9195/g.28517  ORF Transcript_9195/g.28517 Transcript_9195/m.28517 type:complete len:86 (-) Transcript_9195:161-418(-)
MGNGAAFFVRVFPVTKRALLAAFRRDETVSANIAAKIQQTKTIVVVGGARAMSHIVVTSRLGTALRRHPRSLRLKNAVASRGRVR